MTPDWFNLVKRPLRKRFGSHRNDPKRSAKFAQRRGR